MKCDLLGVKYCARKMPQKRSCLKSGASKFFLTHIFLPPPPRLPGDPYMGGLCIETYEIVFLFYSANVLIMLTYKSNDSPK